MSAVAHPTIIAHTHPAFVVRFQYMPKSKGHNVVEAITAQANAVSVRTRAGGLNAITSETTPITTLLTLP